MASRCVDKENLCLAPMSQEAPAAASRAAVPVTDASVAPAFATRAGAPGPFPDGRPSVLREPSAIAGSHGAARCDEWRCDE